MKKTFALFAATALAAILCACGTTNIKEPTAMPTPTNTTAPTDTVAPTDTPVPTEETSKVMTYEEYMAAEEQTEVVIETYVQAHQSWWDNKLTIYCQDETGAYFIYNAAVDEETAAKLVPGTKIHVEGIKSSWSGEVEIADATVSIIDGSYTATVTDATSKLGTDDLASLQNFFVSFKNLTVVAKDGKGFLYKYNGTGSQGDDLYFDVTDGTNTYTFTVESYLCDKDTDVYKAVEAFQGGEKINVEGFLYWYNGAQPHVTAVTAASETAGVMTYAEYVAAEEQTEVVIETYVQAHQSWWDNKLTIYCQDETGAYFIYNAAVDEETAAKLVPGTKIHVEGVKSSWSGEVEIADATVSIIDGSYTATAVDATSKLGTDDLASLQNYMVSFKDLTVVAKDGQGFLYKYNGTGSQGDDLYFDVTDGTNTYTFTVESYLCDKDTDVYKTVESFKGGEKIDVEGFLYWYNGAQPHVTKVTVK